MALAPDIAAHAIWAASDMRRDRKAATLVPDIAACAICDASDASLQGGTGAIWRAS